MMTVIVIAVNFHEAIFQSNLFSSAWSDAPSPAVTNRAYHIGLQVHQSASDEHGHEVEHVT